MKESAVPFVKRLEPCCINVADYVATSLSSRLELACMSLAPTGSRVIKAGWRGHSGLIAACPAAVQQQSPGVGVREPLCACQGAQGHPIIDFNARLQQLCCNHNVRTLTMQHVR